MRGNPHATFDAAGAGNVAWSKCWDTRNRKGEQQGIQTSTYTGAPVLDPTEWLLSGNFCSYHQGPLLGPVAADDKGILLVDLM